MGCPSPKVISEPTLELPQTELDSKTETLLQLPSSEAEKEFLHWYQQKTGLGLSEVRFSHLLLWAEERGMSFNPQTFRFLNVVFDGIRKKSLREQIDEALISERPRLRWLDIMRLQARLEEEEREERAKDCFQEFGSGKVEKSNDSSRDEYLKSQVFAALTFRPRCKDSAMVKELELMLLTNNVPPGETLSVLQFLAELERSCPRVCAPHTGSNG